MRGVLALRLEQGADGAAVAVAADDDVLHLEDHRGELDAGRDAVEAAADLERRHQVADVADDEQVAGQRAGQQVGDDAGVGAADEQRVRALAFVDQALVVLTELREGFPPETLKTLDELLRHESMRPQATHAW